ncbi:MAG: PAS domain S-box protein [Oricola sp.]
MADNGAHYSFIDIAAWDGVRENFLSGKPIAVFTQDLETLLWANGRAAALFGFGSIGEFEEEGPAGMRIALRQIRAAAGSGHGTTARTLLRVTSGMSSKLLSCEVKRIRGRDGTPCILVVIEAGEEGEPERDAALAAISGLAAEGAGAAIIDEHGALVASDPLFADLSFSTDVINALVRDVRDEKDRLVKRLVSPSPAMPVAVAIARLTDSPARHLIMAIKAGDAEVEPESAIVLAPEPAIAEPDVTAWEELVEETPEATIESEVLEPKAAEPAAAFNPDFENLRGPVRFVWKTNRDGFFTDISVEFAAAVGPNAADVVGRSFEDVARVFELDPSGEISASLKRHDTWSGKSVLWPVQGTAFRVPVDLAALPSYNREREFEGYRGFGIVRMGERKHDPEELGMSLTTAGMAAATAAAGTPKPIEEPAPEPVEPEAYEPESVSSDPFRGEVPALLSIAPQPMRRENDKIIDLNSKRRTQPPGEALSANEQAAFRQIGDVLGWARVKAETDNSGEGAIAGEPAPEVTPPTEEAAASDDNDYIAAYEDDADAPAAEEAMTDDDEAAIAAESEAAEIIAVEEATDEAAFEDHHDYLPSAFATGADARQQASGLTPSFLDGLPLPVLIHRDDMALHINDAFAEMSGYKTAAALNAAGGIDALFNGEAAGDGTLWLVSASGETMPARAHMQAVPWHGRTALMFAFEPQPSAATEPHEEAPSAEVSEAAELRAILDTATDGVVVLSSEGVIRSINGSASALFGYSNEELSGKSFGTLFAQESQASALDYLHGLAHNGVASVLNEGLEVLGREKNGGFLPLFMTIGRLETSQGFCAVVRDITAWKQTEQALRDAQLNAESASSHKTEFLAKISHEIRTPLNAIIGFSELMAEERFGPIGNERYKSYLSDINKSGKYVLDLVNDLLDISKIEAGKQDLEFESVSLNEAVSEAVSMIQPQANRNRIIIRSSLDEDLPDVVADARSLKQIVLNILSNSVRFTHSGGQVVINTSYNARGEVVLRIKDTGIGMSTKEIETALQPFQQVASLGRARGDGTGLGLPLTKALVEANRAEFAIQSEPGRGTAIEIVFPPSRVLAS